MHGQIYALKDLKMAFALAAINQHVVRRAIKFIAEPDLFLRQFSPAEQRNFSVKSLHMSRNNCTIYKMLLLQSHIGH